MGCPDHRSQSPLGGLWVISEPSTGFPGYNSIIERDIATISRLLRDNVYSTAWFGKGHNVPAFQPSQSGPFDQWPTGMDFESFNGFVADDAIDDMMRMHQTNPEKSLFFQYAPGATARPPTWPPTTR